MRIFPPVAAGAALSLCAMLAAVAAAAAQVACITAYPNY
jgi:hypothetical protein